MLSFLYPRMDYNVSTMQNHLLKLPFSVHPATRKISVPLSKNTIANFDPENCVTLDSLMIELKGLHHEKALSQTSNTTENAMKTRLNEYVTEMEAFCR